MAEEGAEAAGGRTHPFAGLVGSIWRHPPRGDNAAHEVEVADRRPLWGHSVAWTCLAEPRICLCEGSRGLGGRDPSQPRPPEGERAGWLKPAGDLLGDWLARPCWGGLHRRRPGGRAVVPGGRPFWARDGLRQTVVEPAVAEHTSTAPAIRPHSWVSCPQRCSWQRCMHRGEELPPSPYSLGQGLGEGGREAQAWAWCPAGLGPCGSGQLGAAPAL